jgi:hypothetical protein
LDRCDAAHACVSDATVPLWCRPNNPKFASSAEEWKIVVAPEKRASVEAVTTLGSNGVVSLRLALKVGEEYVQYSSSRTGTPLAVFVKLMDEKNALLKGKGLAPMMEEELIGARLYTGPLFEKYNRCGDPPDAPRPARREVISAGSFRVFLTIRCASWQRVAHGVEGPVHGRGVEGQGRGGSALPIQARRKARRVQMDS